MAERQVRGRPRAGAGDGRRWQPRNPADRVPVLGVDIGGVIVARVEGDADTSFFGSRPMDTPPVAGAAESLRALVTGPFSGRVHLISKAGPAMEQRTRRWLAHVSFYDRTGIPAVNVHFVAKRPDKDAVCTRLGVTHFVDDHVDVLQALSTVPHLFLFNTEPTPRALPDDLRAPVRQVCYWTELEADLIRTVRPVD